MDVRYRNGRSLSRIRYPIIVLLLLLQSIGKPLSGFATAVASLTNSSLVYNVFA